MRRRGKGEWEDEGEKGRVMISAISISTMYFFLLVCCLKGE